eukprot:7352541-Lingulodinium_polyedra.AAC.1
MPWGPAAGDDHTLSELNLYFVDAALARLATQLFEWMAQDGRVDGDTRNEDAEYQARWAYYEIFGIDPHDH